MKTNLKNVTTSALIGELEGRKTKISKLYKERISLETEISRLDKAIDSLLGSSKGKNVKKDVKRTKKVGKKAKTAGKKRGRPPMTPEQKAEAKAKREAKKAEATASSVPVTDTTAYTGNATDVVAKLDTPNT